MGVESGLPQIGILREQIETRFGRKLSVHNDFVLLKDEIWDNVREQISETTLERVWNYSVRGYANVSLHTLDVLSQYAGYTNWDDFCQKLKDESGKESDYFDEESIAVDDLKICDRIRIGWRPDRICIVKYLGNKRFIVEECKNSTSIQSGSIFSCSRFQLRQPLCLDDFKPTGKEEEGRGYIIGTENGLTLLEKFCNLEL